MNHEMFNKMLNAVAHALTSADVELYVAELHKLTDHGLPSDRIKAEEAIMAARRRVGTLPDPKHQKANEIQEIGRASCRERVSSLV